ncbi:hypothetical protein YC2023_120140 [Brassica napus]
MHQEERFTRVFESEEEDRVVFFSGLVESAHLFTYLLLRTMEQDKERFVVEVIGKGSYGVLCAAVDTHTRRKSLLKKINDVSEYISDTFCILCEVKLLWLLRHSDIVEIKNILLPPFKKEFKDIYVVFE